MKSESVEIVCTVDLKPGEKLALPSSLVEGIGPGRWLVSVRPAEGGEIRRHDAFSNSYAPQDEGLYDDCARALAGRPREDRLAAHQPFDQSYPPRIPFVS